MKEKTLTKDRDALKVKVVDRAILLQLLPSRGVGMDAPDPLRPGEVVVGRIMSGCGLLLRAENGNLRLSYESRHWLAVCVSSPVPRADYFDSLPQIFVP